MARESTPSRRLRWALPVLTVIATPNLAAASSPSSPDDAAAARAEVIEAVDALPRRAGAARLATEGYRLKDPLLLIESAERTLELSAQTTDERPLQTAAGHLTVALDMLYFLQGERARNAWRPVSKEALKPAVARALEVERQVEARIDAIITAREAALLAAANPPPTATGKGRITGGAVMLTVGISGAAAGLTGLFLGRQAQQKIDDPQIYGTTWDEWDRRGRTANVVAIAGAGAAALGLAVGIPLLVSGKRAAARANKPSDSARIRVVPTLRGFQLMGRF